MICRYMWNSWVILCYFHFRRNPRWSEWRHNCESLIVVQSAWNIVHTVILVCILGLYCSQIDRKSTQLYGSHQPFCILILIRMCDQNGDFAISINVFICFKQVYFEKFQGFDSNLIKNWQGTFPSREPSSLWKLS